MTNTCAWCGNEIKVQVYVGLGYCSEQHRKLAVLEDEEQRSGIEVW